MHHNVAVSRYLRFGMRMSISFRLGSHYMDQSGHIMETIPKQGHTDPLLWNGLLLYTTSYSCDLSALSFISRGDGPRIDKQCTSRHQDREIARAEEGNAGHIIRDSSAPQRELRFKLPA